MHSKLYPFDKHLAKAETGSDMQRYELLVVWGPEENKRNLRLGKSFGLQECGQAHVAGSSVV